MASPLRRRQPLKIESRLILCLVGTIVLLVVMAIFLRDSLHTLRTYDPLVESCLWVRETTDASAGHLDVVYLCVEAYTRTASLSHLEAYHRARADLEDLLARSDAQARSAGLAIPEADQWRTQVLALIRGPLPRAVDLAGQDRSAATAALAQLTPQINELRALASGVEQAVARNLASLRRQQEDEANGRVLIMWLGVGIIIFFTLIIARVMATSIVRPIQHLRDAVHRLQEGDFTARAHLHTGDEIEDLGNAFNRMAERLLESRRELETKNQTLSNQQQALRDMNLELGKRVEAKTEELQHTLATVSSERGKLEAIIERMPDGLLLLDARGHFIRANDAALDILGHKSLASLHDWMDRMPGAFAFRHLDQRPAALDEFPFSRAFRGESFSNLTLSVRRPDNQTRLVSFSGGPAIGSGLGGTQLSLCIFRDVTEELAMRRELEEKNQQLAEASRLKDEFLATLSHELRTPLTPIISCAQLVQRDGRLSAEDARSLATIERNARSLSRMIDEMLDLSAIMNRKLRLNRELVELNEWVQRTIAPLEPVWQQKRITCTIAKTPQPAMIFVDPARLAQVLTNLVTNAIKYTDDGGTIEVQCRASSDEASIAVRDSGIGLTGKEIDEIFTIFHQTKGSLERRAGGLGIGLSVARSLAELHGGRITVESPGPGMGSTFTLWIPLHRGAAPAPAPAAAPCDASDLSLLRGRKVLLVEDAPDTLDTLRRILERRQCLVAVAASGPEGLDQARRLHPEIILSDLGLPGMDGLEMMTQIRADPSLHNTIAIALSGAGREQDHQAARHAGFQAFLLKPVDLDELDRTLVAALKSRPVTPNAP